ncbi:ClpXP protease specificity-enhancing factor SspB [Deferribacterales bacterium Es71-Z0220]|jgi:hypothetical protein|uniref:ClpXP protease specificity-enhancing factor SspB n=1 Tax=Deferrivibrio essentukiensis TaxID=2880922 RepID=UPI001F604AA4|nr:ClpXP protease specificity-enhancing factor SspB [Deferrivibrio essentukiensis]MCB4204993.1 ClpXP protease specificity-enhancing factor SspB [Deferrivibrio essentukiensis]
MNTSTKLNILKEILYSSEKVYLHIMVHPELFIGKRGLIGKENEEGIVLVFGPQSYKNLEFEEDVIYVEMRFAGKWESLVIPVSAITTVFDSPVAPTFVFNFNVPDIERKSKESQKTITTDNKSAKKQSPKGKVIKIDFKKE